MIATRRDLHGYMLKDVSSLSKESACTPPRRSHGTCRQLSFSKKRYSSRTIGRIPGARTAKFSGISRLKLAFRAAANSNL